MRTYFVVSGQVRLRWNGLELEGGENGDEMRAYTLQYIFLHVVCEWREKLFSTTFWAAQWRTNFVESTFHFGNRPQMINQHVFLILSNRHSEVLAAKKVKFSSAPFWSDRFIHAGVKFLIMCRKIKKEWSNLLVLKYNFCCCWWSVHREYCFKASRLYLATRFVNSESNIFSSYLFF